MMASSPPEMSNVSKASDHDFAELRHWLACDNASCGAMNPPKRCSKCRAAYYCSVDCQRTHWKESHQEECRPMEALRAKRLAQFVAPNLAANNELASSFKSLEFTVCGICLEDTIRHPVILPNCQHMFCFKCLSDYQGCKDLVFEHTDKACPYCRTTIERHVIDEALEKASLFYRRVQLLVDTEHVDQYNEMRRLANNEVDKILESDPRDLSALVMRAQLMVRENPSQAVEMFQHINELDAIGTTDREKVEVMMAEVNAVRFQEGDSLRADQMTRAIADYMAEYEHWPRTFGVPGPRRLWMCHLNLAGAYEIAELYQESLAEYMKIYETKSPCYATEGNEEQEDVVLTKLFFGLSRVSYHLGNYEWAIELMSHFVAHQRTACGAHKLLALPLLAMAEHAATTGAIVTTTNGTFLATLEGVMKVMYKGFMYEDQWNDSCKGINRAFLQELCDKAGAEDE